MNLRRVLMLSACCVVFASGCRQGIDQPELTLPPEVGKTLSTQGFPLSIVNPLIPNTIRDTSAARVVFQHEWRDAPSMTMISMGWGTAAATDPLLRGALGASSAPLETDLAICDSRVVAGVQEPIPPNADGKWTPVTLPLFGGNLVMNRVRGELANISIVPARGSGSTLGTSFTFTAVLKDLHVGLGLFNQGALSAADGYFINVPRVTIVCDAIIVPALDASLTPTFCGEQIVACRRGGAAVILDNPDGGMTTVASNLPAIDWLLQPAMDLVGRPALTEILEKGVKLHFEHYAVSGLGFDSLGNLVLNAQSTVEDGGSSVCSPNAIAPPPKPPTRGLVQTHAYDGYGEVRSRDGYVKRFTLRSTLDAAFIDQGGTAHWVASGKPLRPHESTTDKIGGQFPPISQFNVDRLYAALRVRRDDATCWTKDTTVNDFSRGLPPPVFVLFEGQVRRPAEIAKFASRKFRYLNAVPAPPAEVRVAMGSLGLQCGECTGYWRMDGVLGSPSYPEPWPGPDDGLPFDFEVPPYMGQWWFDRDPNGPIYELMSCNTEFHLPEEEVVLKAPEVWLFDSMFDSTRVNSMGFQTHLATTLSDEGTFSYQGQTHRRVILKEACWAQPSLVCWWSNLRAPSDRFTVGVYDVASGTTMPRRAVRETVRTNMVSTYGAGTGAPWGFFDRSQVDLYSAIPAEYVEAQVTDAGWDWRGSVKADWDHSERFPAPNSAGRSERSWWGHDDMGDTEWWGVRNETFWGTQIYPGHQLIPYRPDFSRDRLMLRRRSASDRSFCFGEQDLTATTGSVRFNKEGTSAQVLVPAPMIFTSAPVTQDGGVTVIGLGNSTGPTAPYFLHAP